MGEDAITELEQLLRDEREAIRRLDGARVLSYAQRKAALVADLRRTGPSPTLGAARLRALGAAVRHNSVLLAHARDILRDAILAARADFSKPMPAAAARSAAAAPPRLVSVRG